MNEDDAWSWTGARRVVITIRERDGHTLTFVSETKAEGIATAGVASGSTVYADKARHWDQLAHKARQGFIYHQAAYSDLDGVHTNNVESCFSRCAVGCAASIASSLIATFDLIACKDHTLLIDELKHIGGARIALSV